METRLGPDAWLDEATRALHAGGIDAVRVEALARALGVTKGSFYWHFRDRAELLEALLASWEAETRWLVADASTAATPRERLLRYFALLRDNRQYPPDVEILAWARREPAVQARVIATEQHRVAFFTACLAAAGVPADEAARRAHTAYLATQGWVERAYRGAEDRASLDTFVAHLFDLVLET